VVHSVCTSVVIAVHSKEDSVPGEELFQVSGFSVTSVWPGHCNHVL
jgi:hypothetical protein